MRTPKVSICIPAYKQTDYLRRILDSIQIQTFTDYEIVITDDTPDNSIKDLVDSYTFKNQVHYFKNFSSLGSPENWNECIRRAKGDYIKIMHHDDWFSYDYSLNEFVKFLDINPNVDFAFSAALVYNEKTKSITTFQPGVEQINALRRNPNLLFFGNLIGPPSSTIFRRSVTLSFDTKMKWVVDLDFYVRVLQLNKEFVNTTQTLITSTTDALHQITNECIGNKMIEVPEYIYFYSKLEGISFTEKMIFFKFFRRLMKQYNILSYREAFDCGYEGEIPWLVKMAIVSNKLV